MSDSSHIMPLEHGQIIPAFSLPGTDNLPHGPWDYKQREHLLLLFLRSTYDPPSQALLRTFTDTYKEFREEQCDILVITAEPVIRNMTAQEELRLPYPLLADPQGATIIRYTHWQRSDALFQPSIVLADRYNALYQQWLVDDINQLPVPIELLESLQYLNRLCTP